MQATPWAEHAVMPFTFFYVRWETRNALAVLFRKSGTERLLCLAEPETPSVQLLADGDKHFTDVPLYRLSLAPARSEHPRILTHPFALAHLYASGQISRDDIEEIREGTAPDTFQVTHPITRRCSLTDMLGVPTLSLVLRGCFDLGVQ